MKWSKIDMQIKRIIGFIGNGLLYISVVKLKVFLIESAVQAYKKLFRTNYISTIVQTLDKNFNMILDVDDKGLTRELLYAKTREVEIIESLSQLLGSTKFRYVVDIGSNVGFPYF